MENVHTLCTSDELSATFVFCFQGHFVRELCMANICDLLNHDYYY